MDKSKPARMIFGIEDTASMVAQTINNELLGNPILWGALFLGAKGSATHLGEAPWGQGAQQWRCNVSTPCGKLSCSYSLGSGYGKSPPNTFEVLMALESDASSLYECSDPISAINSGLLADVDRDEVDLPSALRKAKKFIKGLEASHAKITRAMGPFQHCQGPIDAARIAYDMALINPELDQIGPGKPLGVLEIATIAGSIDILGAMIRSTVYDKDRLAWAIGLAQKVEISHDAIGFLESFLERQELLGLIGSPTLSAPPRSI